MKPGNVEGQPPTSSDYAAKFGSSGRTSSGCQSVSKVPDGHRVFPTDMMQVVQYGPRTNAVAVYLHTYQLLSYERTAEALSEGTQEPVHATANARLAPME